MRCEKMSAAEFNAKYPIGTAVRYHPIIDEPEFIESETRSEAWNLGHGAPVVMIKGKSGGVCLSAVEPIETVEVR